MRLLLLIVAAAIAVVAGVSALQLSTRNSGPSGAAVSASAPPVSTVDVLVARDAIPAGTLMTDAMFDKQPWPENLVLKGFIVSGTPDANIVGKVVRSSFLPREPLTLAKLANANDAGFLAASLPPDMRAVTIATDAVSGVAGFVFPGDRVDVLFTHNVPEDLKAEESKPDAHASVNAEKPAFTEVLLADVPVLAVNLRDGVNKEGTSAEPAVTGVAPSSVTLQVQDTQAEKLRLAERVGTLSLALRSISDKSKPETAAPVDLSNLTQIRASEVPQAEDDTVKVTK